MAFPIEDIPGEASLFLRVHKDHFVPSNDPALKRPSSACFKRFNMSVNWEKYSTAAATAKESSAAVVALVAKDCRSLQQEVMHSPIESGEPDGPNQAHADVRGAKDDKALRDKFVRLSKVVWVRPA